MPESHRPPPESAMESHSTVDVDEIARFSALADEWWDPGGSFRPLHKLNPVRLQFIRDRLAAHHARDPLAPGPLAGLEILDVGCGAGIVAEPFRRLGAEIVAIDPSQENIEAARLHAADGGLSIDYRATTAEALADSGETFDVVTALEVVEHVTDVSAFVGACASMVKPGGIMIATTIMYDMQPRPSQFTLSWLLSHPMCTGLFDPRTGLLSPRSKASLSDASQNDNLDLLSDAMSLDDLGSEQSYEDRGGGRDRVGYSGLSSSLASEGDGDEWAD